MSADGHLTALLLGAWITPPRSAIRTEGPDYRIVASFNPDPTLAALLTERLFELGRFSEIQLLAGHPDLVTRCLDRVTCLAAVQVARALFRLGRTDEATGLLRRLDGQMTLLGFGGARRLATAHDEITGAN